MRYDPYDEITYSQLSEKAIFSLLWKEVACLEVLSIIPKQLLFPSYIVTMQLQMVFILGNVALICIACPWNSMKMSQGQNMHS